MELLQLRYFFESAKNENFAKTAEKYKVPATSVSASVKRLEQELGCRLFNRLPNRITLNNNGKLLCDSLSKIFTELDDVTWKLSSVSTDTREIKMLVRATRSSITDLITEYSVKHPHIAFKTVFDFSVTDFENYDIIIDEESDKYSDFESFRLYRMQLYFKASKHDSLSRRKLTLKQLENQPFISMGEKSNMHNILIKACQSAGFSPNIIAQSNDIKCYDTLIKSGMGIGLGRKNTDDSLICLDVSDFSQIYTVCTYYKEQAAYGNVDHFLKFLKNNATV